MAFPAGKLSSMGFFDDIPVPPPPELDDEPARPVWDKPDDALGVLAGDAFVLARTDDTAIAVTGLTAYPTGFEFDLTVVFRKPDRDLSMRPVDARQIREAAGRASSVWS